MQIGYSKRDSLESSRSIATEDSNCIGESSTLYVVCRGMNTILSGEKMERHGQIKQMRAEGGRRSTVSSRDTLHCNSKRYVCKEPAYQSLSP